MDEKLRAHVLKRDSMNTFMHYNFNEQAELEQDYAVCKLDIRPESLNPFGMVHGGACALWRTMPRAWPHIRMDGCM